MCEQNKSPLLRAFCMWVGNHISYLGMVARYAMSLRRSSGRILSWLLRAGKVRTGPPRLSLPPLGLNGTGNNH